MSPHARTTQTLDFNRSLLARHALARFLARVAAVGTGDDALRLLADRPPAESPGRPFYDRLADFLATLAAPADAGPDELAAYAGLVERLVAAGTVEAGAGATAARALALALEAAPSSRENPHE